MLQSAAYEEAEPLVRKVPKVQRRVLLLGAEHQYTLASMNNLANLLKQTKLKDEAEALCRERMQDTILFLIPHQASAARPAAPPPGTQVSATAST